MLKAKFMQNDKILKSKKYISFIASSVIIASIFSTSATDVGDIVTIVEGDKSRTVYTDSTLVKEIIGEQGIEVTSRDLICPSENSEIDEDGCVIIRRLKPVDVYSEGELLSYWTDAETYGEFLINKPWLVDDDDICDVDYQKKLQSKDNTINITKISRTTECSESEIPFETKIEYDSKLAKGKREVTREGKTGKKITYYNVEYCDGQEVMRSVDRETIVENPVTEVIVEGTYVKPTNVEKTAPAAQAVFGDYSNLVVNGKPVSYKKVITCQATAYDLSFESCGKYPGSPGYGITASGTYAKPGTVAVDPSVIPLGTKMYIVSTDGSVVYGFCTAEDTGGAIKGNKVDLFYNTKQECMQFGRRNVLVYIL